MCVNVCACICVRVCVYRYALETVNLVLHKVLCDRLHFFKDIKSEECQKVSN